MRVRERCLGLQQLELELGRALMLVLVLRLVLELEQVPVLGQGLELGMGQGLELELEWLKPELGLGPWLALGLQPLPLGPALWRKRHTPLSRIQLDSRESTNQGVL